MKKRNKLIIKRTLSKVLLVTLIATFMSGCGKKKDTKSSESSTTSKEVETTVKKENEDDVKNENLKNLSIELKNVNVSLETDVYINCGYAIPNLQKEEREEFPELAKAFDDYAVECENTMKDTEEYMIEVSRVDGDGKTYTELNDRRFAKIMRADSNVVSIYNRYEGYYGGAHGDYGYTGVSFDTETGKRLELPDIVNDVDEFFEVLEAKLLEKFPDYKNTVYYEEGSLTSLLYDDVLEWTISSEAVTVYFNNYTIASFAEGPQIVTINFNENPELFNKKYMEVPREYVIPCTELTDYFIDVDEDGKNELLDIQYTVDEYDMYKWVINVGERKVSIENVATAPTGYIVYSNDRYYLYLMDEYDMSGMLRVVDLNNMTYDRERDEQVGLLSYGYEDLSDGSRSVVSDITAVITKPSDFILEKTFYVLSTIKGYNSYSVDKNGYPKSDDEFFIADTNVVLKAKEDVDCEIVDEDGKVTGKGKISKGKYYMFVCTNGEDWVDLQIINEKDVVATDNNDFKMYMKDDEVKPDDDEYIYRVKLEWDDEGGNHTIDGVSEYDVFDGIMYAG